MINVTQIDPHTQHNKRMVDKFAEVAGYNPDIHGNDKFLFFLINIHQYTAIHGSFVFEDTTS